ncbi:MAG: rhodanese-like domain-containing protein, partial [Dehalococcoidia bacterium]|nr:rhodanese-like domain-containing protein [Dehalococcoidia bacterium]
FVVLLIVAVSVSRGLGNSVDGPSSQIVGQENGYASIASDELAQMLKTKDFYLVNVHVPYIGEIEGTDAKIPYNQIKENLDKFPKDAGVRIVVYCMSGSMSKSAAQTLAALGYTNVLDLKGGMSAWEQAGHKLLMQ